MTEAGRARPASRRARLVVVILAGAVLVSACESTSVPGLNVRARPTTDSAVVASLGATGTSVTVACHTRGGAVHGDRIWYRITRPEVGWVSNYYIRTRANVLDSVDSC